MLAPYNMQELLQKDVSRKEFIGIAGLAIASIFGFGMIVRLLTGKSLQSHAIIGGHPDVLGK